MRPHKSTIQNVRFVAVEEVEYNNSVFGVVIFL